MKIGTPFNPFGLYSGIYIPNCILQSSITSDAKLLLGRLMRYAGENGSAYPKRKKLIKDLNWNLRKLDRIIAELKKEQLIQTFKKEHDSPSTYVFLYHPLYEIPAVKSDSNPIDKSDSTPTVKSDRTIKKKKTKKKKDKENFLLRKNEADASGNGKSKKFPTLKRKFDYSEYTRKVLAYWKIRNGKVHIKEGAKGAEIINTMIEELLMKGINPYSSVVDDETKMKQWTVDEIIHCIHHYTGVLKKDISKIYFDRFIIARNTGRYRNLPDHSPLAETFLLLGELPTKQSEKLKQVFTNGKPISDTIFIRAANKVIQLDNKFMVSDASCESYRKKIINVFIKYVKEKQNDSRFKIGYMCADNFVDEFVDNMVKRNVLTKKSNGGIQVGRRVE